MISLVAMMRRRCTVRLVFVGHFSIDSVVQCLLESLITYIDQNYFDIYYCETS